MGTNRKVILLFVEFAVIFCFPDLLTCTVIDYCNDILCSNLYDPVCGEARALDGNRVIKRFHNICHFNKIRCRLKFIDTLNLERLPNGLCNIEMEDIYVSGRRLNDYSIVGAHQACNHTCPTYCLDIYDPVCAQIWKPNMRSYVNRPMVNHCHVDLYSCVLGVNVTIAPLIGRCYKNPSALNFMFNIASLKTLNLLDEPDAVSFKSRRSQSVNRIELMELRDFLKAILKSEKDNI